MLRLLDHFLAPLFMIALFAASSSAAHPSDFDLERIMGAPYISSLAAAPSGRAVAWVVEVKGARNVWVGGGASVPRQLTTFSGDNGYDIGELAWSADGKGFAFTRAQTLDDISPANVASAPEGFIEPQVWFAPLAGGPPRKLGIGQGPKVSPNLSLLAFVDKSKILVANLVGESDAKVLLTDIGSVSSLTWSPDGRRLAFVSNRPQHTLIGVYDFAARSVTWMAPSFDRDSAPVFSPDGSRIAFVRTASERPTGRISHRQGEPWSIWVADISTGTARRAWVADRGQGSLFTATLANQNLFWTASEQLVFPWEKTGWLQLYAISPSGGRARALTTGEFEVADMSISADRRQVVVTTNQGDADRMHVWRIDLEHGGQSPLGLDQGLEASPLVGDDGAVFALRSEATRPLEPVVLEGSGWRTLAPGAIDAGFPDRELVKPQSITFQAKDGMLTHAQIFLPKDGASTHPAILFFHGGPRRQMLLGFHFMDAYYWMYAMNQYLVSEGYIVLSVNYRGGTGYGLAYREAAAFGPDGSSELNDLLGSITYLKGRKDVDTHHIGAWGASYGGLMTALALSRASDSIAAGVDYAGIYDWTTALKANGQPLGTPEQDRRARAASPIATIDQWRAPVLVAQADDDRDVAPEESFQLVQDLRARGVEHDELLIPNEVHDLTRWNSWMVLFQATDKYFQRYLQKTSHLRAAEHYDPPE